MVLVKCGHVHNIPYMKFGMVSINFFQLSLILKGSPSILTVGVKTQAKLRDCCLSSLLTSPRDSSSSTQPSNFQFPIYLGYLGDFPFFSAVSVVLLEMFCYMLSDINRHLQQEDCFLPPSSQNQNSVISFITSFKCPQSSL